MSSPPFVHLHLHGHFSFLRSSIRLKELCERSAELGIVAVVGSVWIGVSFWGAVDTAFCRIYRLDCRGWIEQKRFALGMLVVVVFFLAASVALGMYVVMWAQTPNFTVLYTELTDRDLSQVVDALDADVVADEPIWHGGEVVGFCTSGGFAHFAGVSVALGFLPVELIAEGREVEIEILGERRPARLITEPLFDPTAERMRG